MQLACKLGVAVGQSGVSTRNQGAGIDDRSCPAGATARRRGYGFQAFLSRTFLIAVVALGLSAASADAELTPSQIALIVNKQVPESRPIAEFYCKARSVPLDHILELNMSAGDEMSADAFEQLIEPQIRKWITDRGWKNQIKCLVSCYGVPLRIANRVNSPRDTNELNQLRDLHTKLLTKLETLATQSEAAAREADPSYQPAVAIPGVDPPVLHASAAAFALQKIAASASAPAAREVSGKALLNLVKELKTAPDFESPLLPATNPTSQPTTESLFEMSSQTFDPQARRTLRGMVLQQRGLIGLTQVVRDQIGYLTTDESAASFDSELSLLWWPTYPRAKWEINPLNLHFANPAAPKTVMTVRLDAPTAQGVRNLIADSVEIERTGLGGKLVIDARGLPATGANGQPDPYGVFDESLRTLAGRMKKDASLEVVLDNKPEVLPPGSQSDVAVYLGWYSVHNYVSAMKFSRGAIGIHFASYELLDLHGARETGWVHGLLNDGVVGSVGPVAEPYLASFPDPNAFVPLLLSGKITMAEVYWATNPMCSWMQDYVGDPLYCPFKNKPAIKVEALDPALQKVIQAASVNGR